MSKLVFLLGLTLLAVASARVTRDAPATPELTIEGIFDVIKDGLSKMGNTVLSVTGSTDANDLQEKAVKQFNVAKDKIAVWIKSAQEETEHIKETPLVKDLRTSLENFGNDFKANHPALAEGVSDEIKKAQDHLDDIVKKIKALEESDEAKQFKDTTDKLLASAKAQVEELASELKLKPKTK